VPSSNASIPQASERITKHWHGFSANRGVGELTALLKQLLVDIDQGMLTSVADQARAETLDDLLDQAAEYHKLKHLTGSGIGANLITIEFWSIASAADDTLGGA